MAIDTTKNDYTSQIVSGLEINKCEITSSAGTLDFKNVVGELNYYEDIFSNSVSGTLLINDSMGQPIQLSWNGEEKLDLEINKPDGVESNPLKGTYRIYNISGRNLTRDDNENYIVNFCNEEVVLNEKRRVCKAYKNQYISDIVKDIAVNYLGIKNFPSANIEKTYNKVNLVIPNLKPFEAINWLCTMAISGDSTFGNAGLKGGANYLFWRDRKEYHFRSLNSIFNNVSEKSAGKNWAQYVSPLAQKGANYGYGSGYWYGMKNVDYPDNIDWDPYEQILSYQILNTYDPLECHQRGIYGNRLIAVDYVTRERTNSDFNYDKYFDYLNSNVELYKHYNNSRITNNAVDRFGKKETDYPESTTKILPSSSVTGNDAYVKQKDTGGANAFNITPNYVENTAPYRYAQLGLINFNRLKIVVPGDPYITIGKMIFVHFPQTAKDDNGEKMLDRFLAGRYLITCVRHILDQENTYVTVLELVKDAYADVGATKKGLDTFNANQTIK